MGLSHAAHLLLDNEAADRRLSEACKDGKGRGAAADTQPHNCPAPADALLQANFCQVARQELGQVHVGAEDSTRKTACTLACFMPALEHNHRRLVAGAG